MHCDFVCCNSFATLSFHICNSFVTRVSQKRTLVKGFGGFLSEKMQFFKKIRFLYRNITATQTSQMHLKRYSCVALLGFKKESATLFAYCSVRSCRSNLHIIVYSFTIMYIVTFYKIQATKKESSSEELPSHNSGNAILYKNKRSSYWAALTASICLISSGTTLNRSPTMP